MIPGRSASAVSIAERKQESIQSALLNPSFPGFTELSGRRVIGVAGGQKGIDFRSVRALPGKIVIRESLAFVIGPENFLGNQIFNPGTLENLRKSSGIPKGIREPQHH